MENKQKEFIIDAELLVKIFEHISTVLKEKEVVKEYVNDAQNRIFTIALDYKKYKDTIPDTEPDEFLPLFVFSNIKNILKDINVLTEDEIEEHTILIPMYTTTYDKNKIIINY